MNTWEAFKEYCKRMYIIAYDCGEDFMDEWTLRVEQTIENQFGVGSRIGDVLIGFINALMALIILTGLLAIGLFIGTTIRLVCQLLVSLLVFATKMGFALVLGTFFIIFASILVICIFMGVNKLWKKFGRNKEVDDNEFGKID